MNIDANLLARFTTNSFTMTDTSSNTMLQVNKISSINTATLNGDLRLNNTTGYVNFKIPSSLTSYNLTFPANIGSTSQYLALDSSGNFVWTAPTAGSSISNINGSSQTSTVSIDTTDHIDIICATNQLARFTTNSFLLQDTSAVSMFQVSKVSSINKATITGDIRISNSTNFVDIKVPASGLTSYDLTFPVSQGGSGQILQNNGSGILSWASSGSGGSSITDVTTNNTVDTATTNITATVANNIITETTPKPLTSSLTQNIVCFNTSYSSGQISQTDMYITLPAGTLEGYLNTLTVGSTDTVDLNLNFKVYEGSISSGILIHSETLLFPGDAGAPVLITATLTNPPLLRHTISYTFTFLFDVPAIRRLDTFATYYPTFAIGPVTLDDPLWLYPDAFPSFNIGLQAPHTLQSLIVDNADMQFDYSGTLILPAGSLKGEIMAIVLNLDSADPGTSIILTILDGATMVYGPFTIFMSDSTGASGAHIETMFLPSPYLEALSSVAYSINLQVTGALIGNSTITSSYPTFTLDTPSVADWFPRLDIIYAPFSSFSIHGSSSIRNLISQKNTIINTQATEDYSLYLPSGLPTSNNQTLMSIAACFESVWRVGTQPRR